ncbi:hypothetical protein ACQ0P8_13525 [Halodesulfovibrio aestuarii]|uniref:Thymidylate kinase n=1 Tax=Halodesulfovibrio aestuarii TaxID=126333 RepID=A0A8G2CAC5_9BACT|nr:hypothetical protein [Halodesulfovibrio aestuarii]SHJ29141.1 hypothetical protein SAMN05660830_02095 [Halodesulfovibrio aestuarii]
MLELYRICFESLKVEGVYYASWKNNHKLARALQAKSDIDLLVAKRDRRKFEKILLENNFVAASNAKLFYPEIAHYYGLDVSSGEICHLHVYYDLVTGTSHGKEYCFNFCDEVLASRFVNSYGIYEVGIEEQALLFVLRHYVKRSSFLGALLYQKECSDYKAEREYLMKNYSENKGCCRFGHSSDQLFILSTNFLEDFFLCWRKKQSLKWNLRATSLWLTARGVSRFGYRLLNKLVLKQKKKVNGVAVAVTGIDGAGKSTLLANLHAFFSTTFSVKQYHFGRPNPTLLTTPIRIALFFRSMRKSDGKCSLSAQCVPDKISIAYALRYVALAYERAVLMRKIQQDVMNGYVVFVDRCHSLDSGKMDSPRIAERTSNSFVVGFLGSCERSLYERMPKVDLAIMLQGDLNTFVLRNQLRDKVGKESDEEIEKRYWQNCDFSPVAKNVQEVSAEMSPKDVSTAAKKIVWEFL